MVVTSRLKRSLGLRAMKRRSMVGARPMMSAEIMRRQMGVNEQTYGLTRKTLIRCLVGPQMPKKVESLVLPMEFLRCLKASEFAKQENTVHGSSVSSSSLRQALSCTPLYCWTGAQLLPLSAR